MYRAGVYLIGPDVLAEAEGAVGYVLWKYPLRGDISVDGHRQRLVELAALESVGGFSRQSLIEQLQYEGFLYEDAAHAASEVGL